MKRVFLIVFLLGLCVSIQADNSRYFDMLTREMEKSYVYSDKKEKQLGELRSALRYSSYHETLTRLELCDRLFQVYYDFQYDSAMMYIRRGLELARRVHNRHYEVLNLMHRGLLLSLAGFFGEGMSCIHQADSIGIPQDLQREYWNVRYLFATFQNDYDRDSEFSHRMEPEVLNALNHAMAHTPRYRKIYPFYRALYFQYLGKTSTAVSLWERVVKTFRYGDALYAQSAYNLAVCYQQLGKDELYERWLIQSAIGDIRCATRQNAAMEMLAIHTFKKPGRQIRLAEKFVDFSLHDAEAYNSRLRKLGVARSWPSIIGAYQQMLTQSNRTLRLILTGMTVLLIGVFLLTYFLYRQNKKLNDNRCSLRKSNENLDLLNIEIEEKNRQLLDVNAKREGLAKVYIDLCEKYIERFHSFKTLVNRKIKSNQVRDLQSKLSGSELSKEEAESFLRHFDKAFLQLYPTFVTEFNALLRPDAQILLSDELALTSELRIGALIRLGVRDSSEMANLLFYSPQTIYNYRWSLKSKAVNKDCFEEDVRRLCRFK